MPRKTFEMKKGLVVDWLGHSSVGIYGKKIIYIDPFSDVLKGDEKKADLIISTHGHGDHFDAKAINALSKEGTCVMVKSGCKTGRLSSNRIIELEINDAKTFGDVEIKTIHAYNTKRFMSPGTPFHPIGFGMGVILVVEGSRLYYAGDTDFIEPMNDLKDEKIDVAFLPIGGTFTMDIDEATEAVLAIEPKMVIPVHYNHIKGTEANPAEFKEKVEKTGKTKVVILR